MDNFHRTRDGQKFFREDFPHLISVLSDISKQLELINKRKEKKFKLEERLMKKKINESK